jgi:hypothetical protein
MPRLLAPSLVSQLGVTKELRELLALNVDEHGLLEDGAAASSQANALGKSLGKCLRARYVEIPLSLVAE